MGEAPQTTRGWFSRVSMCVRERERERVISRLSPPFLLCSRSLPFQFCSFLFGESRGAPVLALGRRSALWLGERAACVSAGNGMDLERETICADDFSLVAGACATCLTVKATFGGSRYRWQRRSFVGLLFFASHLRGRGTMKCCRQK